MNLKNNKDDESIFQETDDAKFCTKKNCQKKLPFGLKKIYLKQER